MKDIKIKTPELESQCLEGSTITRVGTQSLNYAKQALPLS